MLFMVQIYQSININKSIFLFFNSHDSQLTITGAWGMGGCMEEQTERGVKKMAYLERAERTFHSCWLPHCLLVHFSPPSCPSFSPTFSLPSLPCSGRAFNTCEWKGQLCERPNRSYPWMPAPVQSNKAGFPHCCRLSGWKNWIIPASVLISSLVPLCHFLKMG